MNILVSLQQAGSFLREGKLEKAWELASQAYFEALRVGDAAGHLRALTTKAEVLWTMAIDGGHKQAKDDVEWLLENVFVQAGNCKYPGMTIDVLTACRGAMLHDISVVSVEMLMELPVLIKKLKYDAGQKPEFGLLEAYGYLAELVYGERVDKPALVMAILGVTQGLANSERQDALHLRWVIWCIRAKAHALVGQTAQAQAALTFAKGILESLPVNQLAFYARATHFYEQQFVVQVSN